MDNNNIKYIPITTIKEGQTFDKDYYQQKATPDTQSPKDGYYHVNVGVQVVDELKSATTIRVSEMEKKLFQLLMTVVRESGCGSTLRVAGGWVRDKLRGDNSHDIDIALDNMMGATFAELVNKHLEETHQEVHRIGVIQSNPDQSKHLETATVKVYDMWIDFVNLRSETYTEGSRIPTIDIGTPLEDALRRDLTINSLFFNINENLIQDYIGTAIKDLQLGIIRTPLPPLTTFLDDPLRVFRSIRFATRMYFAIDKYLMEAASNQQVKDAIHTKISHQRIAKEFDGMVTGPRPDLAIHLIQQLGLYQYLFALPPGYNELSKINYIDASCNYINQMMRLAHWGENSEELSTKRVRLLSALMIPFHTLTYKNPQNKNRIQTLIQYILLDHLKLSNKDYDDVILILDCAKMFLPLITQFQTNNTFNRKLVGLAMAKAGVLWRASLSIAMVIELPDHQFNFTFPMHDSEETPKIFNHHTHTHPHHQPMCDQSKNICLLYDQFCATIDTHGLIGCWSIKRLLDGNQVKEILQKAPGSWLAPVIQAIFEWQLENPTKTVDQCKEWLIATYK
ncbi:tRNA nucleotidyltransferase [Tieghemostelium lacteum]|uniref:tRNA nucleotidyltransferase n=1 Tax=Tieghemostelium lacteum TaxID=361077 RepID=A0A151ZAR6_TIELA|nr:tRNA nucleotidyltransferase [Tieghemostelium lacteum]|eukprot:KYQ91040.1 tRNA nucleotidyltransferase [Tieghemostelium lacteum]